MSVILDKLQQCVSQIEPGKTLCIAYSGGIDSSALLHAAKTICTVTGHTLKAFHVDHQIHADSRRWAQQCENQCHEMGIEIQIIPAKIEPFRQLGVEAAAREARYQAFANRLSENDVLLTAHHADDQIETMLLQLFRGAGSHGLAACAPFRKLGNALLVRPWLEITRHQIEQYARLHNISWLEDPSNSSLMHDRNYLRHQVMPLLHQRWPGLHQTMVRSALWQSETSDMLDTQARLDALEAVDEAGRLIIEKVDSFEQPRQKNLLRGWIRSAGYQVPSAHVIQQVIHGAILSRYDCEACIRWQQIEIRKFRGRLYLQKVQPEHDATLCLEWVLKQPLEIPSLGMTLTPEQLGQFGVNIKGIEQVTVSFRRGGEVMRPRGRGCQKTLKALFQEQGIEPWERDRIPLLFHQQRLIFVWGYWIGEGY